jgi:disulfide bond formation protein DsbB
MAAVGVYGAAMLVRSQTQGTRVRADVPLAASLIIAAVGTLTIAGAWFFELIIGLKPCPMCLEQRWPYYIGIPLALIVALAAWRRAPRVVLLLGLLAIAGLMIWNVYMGVFHAGVEWKWWLGPQECSGAAQLGQPGGLLDRLKTINVTRCDEAAWRFVGLSLAGYNALISGALAVIALLGAKAAYGSSSVSQ